MKKIKNKIFRIYSDILWNIIFIFYKNPKNTNKLSNEVFTIGITTFMDRYKNCFKPLIRKLTYLFPHCQIVVIANGHVKQKEQFVYLTKIDTFCKKFKNVKLISFHNPVGLSKMWNLIINNSDFEKILILNDDLNVELNFREFIFESNILSCGIAVINTSWSHFLITKDIYNKVGPFDENLIEIGGEDDDYIARLALMKIKINHFSTTTISPKLRKSKKMLKVNSYGKNMYEQRYGYSTVNSEYLESKWLWSNEYFDGAVEVPDRFYRFWKLKT